MDRAESIKFKLMPDGHIRGFQANTPDLRGVSELQIYPPPYLRSDNNCGALSETAYNGWKDSQKSYALLREGVVTDGRNTLKRGLTDAQSQSQSQA